LGACQAAGLAEMGFEVLGVDNDAGKVASLSRGRAPFYEPGLDALLRRHVGTGRLRFTASLAAAAEFGDVHFLCLGTPQRADCEAADLSQLHQVVEGLGPLLRRQCLVVGRSTVPVGTAADIARRLTELAPAGLDVEVAWNPEFLREGSALSDVLRPDRIVVGVQDSAAEKALRQIYAHPLAAGVPLVVTDLATAELVKVAANAFLATKLSFINAIADLCSAVGGDVVSLSDAIGHDARIGRSHLDAGLGFGGGCLPKDVRGFAVRAGELGVDKMSALLGLVDDINSERRELLVELAVQECCGEVAGKAICVLGAAFKPGSDDVRDSPALAVASRLHRRGARVRVFDPRAKVKAAAECPELEYADSVGQAAQDADLVMHLTDWPEFGAIDAERLGAQVARRRIVDGRNSLDRDVWRAAGWTYVGVGRG
ncbi:MAG: UDP-glucose/GDP-mannose dehydrogenase family protein, partial [Nocardioidaceae bacterium]|nr:UDP-glucose/GDP-mannose dehydrogenase family protein [Nocardioidaceae bacterium]